MSKLNKEQVISKFSELKDSKVDDKAFDRFDDHEWLQALDILFAKWIDDTKTGKYNYERLSCGGGVDYSNKQIVDTIIDSGNYSLAYYIDRSLAYAMNGNDMEEYLTYLIAKSDYAKVFVDSGLTLLLDIVDENVFDDYVERTIQGLGLERMFASTNIDGFNEKTGKYQYVTYSDCTE
jgi:hypothetical protein